MKNGNHINLKKKIKLKLGIRISFEENMDAMIDSYTMIDPRGRFYQYTGNLY